MTDCTSFLREEIGSHIKGVGLDIVHIPRIAAAIDKWGDRFLKRILTDKELRTYQRRARKDNFVALRFAAKEAFSKALGTGMRSPMTWHALEVTADGSGRPGLCLSEDLMGWCRSRSIKRWHVSLSDDNNYAVAVVILEGE